MTDSLTGEVVFWRKEVKEAAAISHRALPRPFGCLPLFGL